MNNIDYKKLTRNCVRNFAPYIPGRPISEIKQKYNLKRIVKLASNENPLGPSKNIYPALVKELKNLFYYPVGNSESLRKTISETAGVRIEEVLAGSGSDELIEVIGKTFINPEDNIVISKSAFIRYKMTGELMNARVLEAPMKDFRHDLDAMRAKITLGTKVIIIANPNNPTGTYVTKTELESFLKLIDPNILVCLDEAYYDYAAVNDDYPNGIEFYKKGFKNLIILRTFSKIYALAGLRVGYAIGNPDVIDSMDRIRPPFNVNTMAQIAAQVSILDKSQVKRGQKLIKTQKRRFYEYLDSIGVNYLKSAANFVLVDARTLGYPTGKELFLEMLKKGIIVREMSEYELPEWVRITISLPADMTYLFKVIKQLKKK